VQRGKEAEGFRRVRKPAVNYVVAVVFSYFLSFNFSLLKGRGL
jgi:DNA-binding protein